jgi:hypothetical protein
VGRFTNSGRCRSLTSSLPAVPSIFDAGRPPPLAAAAPVHQEFNNQISTPIDSALAARKQLGYSARISKKSYGRAVEQATDIFERLQGTTAQSSRDYAAAPARCSQSGHSELGRRGRRLRSR